MTSQRIWILYVQTLRRFFSVVCSVGCLSLISMSPIVLSSCAIPGFTPPASEASEEEDAEEETSEEGEESEEENTEEEKPALPPPEPIQTHLFYTKASDFTPKTLTWTSPDGVLLTGQLYSPAGEIEAFQARELAKQPKPVSEDGEEEAEEEAPEEEEELLGEDGEPLPPQPQVEPERPLPAYRYPLVIVGHKLSSSSKRIQFLVPDLVKMGYAVLLLDLRGHGASSTLASGESQSWRLFKSQAWLQLPHDFRLTEQYFKHPELDKQAFPLEVMPKRMAMIVEGISANAMLIRSNEKDADIKAIVSLGATLESKGLTSVLPVMNSRIPTLYMASQSEPMSFEDTQKLFRITEAKKALRLYGDVGSGIEILLNDKSARQEAVSWIRRYLPPATVDPAFTALLKTAEQSWAKQNAKKKK